MGTPLLVNHVSTCPTEAAGETLLSKAQAPATCGVAIDVPAYAAYPPLGYATDETTQYPGASTSSKRSPRRFSRLLLGSGAFENDATTSGVRPFLASVLAPTAIADEIQAGADTPSV
jgi:hypothetical protein